MAGVIEALPEPGAKTMKISREQLQANREANKSYQKPATSILDQWEPAPEWAKDAKRADLHSVNNTTVTGPDGCFPALS